MWRQVGHLRMRIGREGVKMALMRSVCVPVLYDEDDIMCHKHTSRKMRHFYFHYFLSLPLKMYFKSDLCPESILNNVLKSAG